MPPLNLNVNNARGGRFRQSDGQRPAPIVTLQDPRAATSAATTLPPEIVRQCSQAVPLTTSIKSTFSAVCLEVQSTGYLVCALDFRQPNVLSDRFSVNLYRCDPLHWKRRCRGDPLAERAYAVVMEYISQLRARSLAPSTKFRPGRQEPHPGRRHPAGRQVAL